MSKKYYNPQFMREYRANHTIISNDGLHVERNYMDNGVKKTYEPKIYLDSDSQRNFIELKKYGVAYIDEMVITCYWPPKPKDGKRYVVHHKDWNFGNDHKNNLEWVEETPEYLAERAEKMKEYLRAKRLQWYKDQKITVDEKKGIIKQDGVTLSVYNSISDSDLGYLFHTTTPKVDYRYKVKYANSGQIRYESSSLEVDKVMADFGLVYGNKENLKEPVILHVNHDFLDFTPYNLIWCEKSNPDYAAYRKKAQEDRLAQDKESNGRWLSPSEWDALYGSIDEYQDWSDLKGKDPSWTPERIAQEIEEIKKRKKENATPITSIWDIKNNQEG